MEGAGIEPGHGNQMLRGVLLNSRLDDRDELLATRHGRCSLASMMQLCLARYEGRTLNEVAEQLGHADPGFTARTYAHVVRDASRRRRVPIT